MRIDRNELIGILGVSNGALKQIIRKSQLEDRLHDKGYKLINTIKEGRKTFYEVEEVSQSKNTLSNICKHMFNTNKVEEFSTHLMCRITSTGLPVTKQMLSDKTGVSKETIRKWDNGLIDNDILKKDGYFYIAIDVITDEDGNEHRYVRPSDKYEFETYMRNSRFARKKKNLAEQFKNDEIDYDTFILAMDGATSYQQANENKFVYRIDRYARVRDNMLLKDIVDMIREVVGGDFGTYYLGWDETLIESGLME